MAAGMDQEKNTRVLVAGATGTIGRQVVKELRERGLWVRALTRHQRDGADLGANEVVSADIETGERMAAAFVGKIDIVVSTLGNNLRLASTSDKSSFWDVDFRLNKALVERAKQAGARRFVYVSAFAAPGYRETAYIKAHEAAAGSVRDSGMEYAVVRPTGLFSSFQPLINWARRGRLPLVGDGYAYTNPIDDRDVAALVTEAALSEKQAQDIAAGGPEMMTRRELADRIFSAWQMPPHYNVLSENLVRFLVPGAMVGLVDRRLGELLDFYVKVTLSNSVAPPVGKRRLDDFLAAAVTNEDPLPAAERKLWGGQTWSLHFVASKKR